jgi:hypothetical protein
MPQNHEKKPVRVTGLMLLIISALLSGETEPAQKTRSDQKDAKAVIRDTLGPRNYAPHP